MSRKSNIKNILNGLLCSFITRNNDVNGYWGIGKLYSLMLNKKTNRVEIDLINKTIIPFDDEFIFRISEYSEMLLNKLKLNEIDLNYLKSAKIVLTCRDLNVEKRKLNTIYCKITFIDKNNKEYKQITGTMCRKHNPKSESKSGRTYENKNTKQALRNRAR